MDRSPAFTLRVLALGLVTALAVPAAAQVVAPTPLPQEPAAAARKGDPANGKVIAQRWCAECHVVTPEQTSGKADVPPFSAIAAKGYKDDSLQRFLMNPHPKMPDMQIGRNEAADLVAWIDLQKK
ncbi:cytochrome c [uncultured Alsobacter sp.]|uniref:c-type cytochrome n=1 Tax=uncultured Alsobacter sp. TaxID=1748258 RepID=UPI0025FA4EA6|nr:cytochrome c [uncultured Alsobacter sp.]